MSSQITQMCWTPVLQEINKLKYLSKPSHHYRLIALTTAFSYSEGVKCFPEKEGKTVASRLLPQHHVMCLLRQLILLLTHWAQPTVAWRDLPSISAHHKCRGREVRKGFFYPGLASSPLSGIRTRQENGSDISRSTGMIW